MNILDINAFLSIKISLLIFFIFSLFFIASKRRPDYFLWLMGLTSALSFFFLVNDLQLPFWGLQGDEITLMAMYNTFAQIGLGADFAYHNLPPFYPPGYFWLFGVIGSLFSLGGVVLYKIAAFSFFLFFPAGLYYFIKYIFKEAGNNELPGKIFIFLAPLMIISIIDKDLLFGKPYEILSAALTIFWYACLHIDTLKGKLSYKKVVIYGLIAGIIFLIYYLWLIFAALAFLILLFWQQRSNFWTYLFSLTKVAMVALVVGAPFWLPLLISYINVGMESWQTAFFTPEGLDLWMPFLQINNLNSIVLLFGFIVMIYLYKRKFVKELIVLFITCYLWWGIGMFMLLIFKTPFQEFRGFYVLAPTILAISAAYGIDELFNRFNVVNKNQLYWTLCILGLLYLISQSIFGSFIDKEEIKEQRAGSKLAPKTLVDIVSYLQSDESASVKLTLNTNPQILAFIALNNLVYFNQHNNHPGAIFSERYEYVLSLAGSKTPEEIYEKVKNCPYGKLERFIFYKANGNYYLYFHLDKIIKGIEVREVVISEMLFDSDKFKKVYEKDGFVIIDVL